jgi:H/ACA ribonucleoprotein complex subunit 4
METLLPFERIEREVLVKRNAKTGSGYGKHPDDRSVAELLDKGIVNVDKPKGPTSHQISAYVQKILNLDKSGHGGTLDPAVCGVLPVAIGSGTRIVQALLPAGKEYVMIMHVHKDVDSSKLRDTIMKFVGKIKQMPPIKSAVKRQWRYRKIYYIEIIEINDRDVLMRVGCQAGTYMRKLCTDIGKELGTGAHMAELVRTKAGPFNESTKVNLQQLTDAYWVWKNEGREDLIRSCVQPLEAGVRHLAKIWVTDYTVDPLCNGADLKAPGVAKVESEIQVDDLVAIMTLKDELVCIGNAKMHSNEIMKASRGIVVQTSKVFMSPGIYPRMEKKE